MGAQSQTATTGAGPTMNAVAGAGELPGILQKLVAILEQLKQVLSNGAATIGGGKPDQTGGGKPGQTGGGGGGCSMGGSGAGGCSMGSSGAAAKTSAGGATAKTPSAAGGGEAADPAAGASPQDAAAEQARIEAMKRSTANINAILNA